MSGWLLARNRQPIVGTNPFSRGVLLKPPRSSLLFIVAAWAGIPLWAANARPQETQRQKQEQAGQQNQYRDQSQSLQETQQRQNIQAYRGQIAAKHGKYYLEEAHTRASYTLEDTWEAKKFLNKKVRVTGWLDPDKNVQRHT